VAVDLAVKSLRNGESNLALAGGVNLLLHPFTSNIMDYVIAPDGKKVKIYQPVRFSADIMNII